MPDRLFLPGFWITLSRRILTQRFGLVFILFGAGILSCRTSHSSNEARLRRNQQLAERGDLSAQMWLANHYDEGTEGLPKNIQLASTWYLEAAKQGDPAAQYAIATRYEVGDGIEKNEIEAIHWLEKCINNGRGRWQGEACIALSNRYQHGNGVPKDEGFALELTARAAAQGNSAGLFFLAVQHSIKSDKEDQRVGKAFLESSAEQGFAPAEYFLATNYEKGSAFLNQDMRLACKWARKAAEQSYPEGEYLFAALLFDGRGVSKDEKEAAKWFLKAAEHGNLPAMAKIGELYYRGIGVPKNSDLGKQWAQKYSKSQLDEANKAFSENKISRSEYEQIKKGIDKLRRELD